MRRAEENRAPVSAGTALTHSVSYLSHTVQDDEARPRHPRPAARCGAAREIWTLPLSPTLAA